MPKSKIETRLILQLAAKGNKNAAEMAHGLLVEHHIIKPSGELTAKGKVRNDMTPAERAKERAAKASEGLHKPSEYVYNKKTNRAKLKGNK